MNKIIYFLPLAILLLISGCAQQGQESSTATPGDVINSNSTDGYEPFCQKLSSCEQSSLKIKAGGTDDIYSLNILGLKNGNCEIKLGLEKSGHQSTKSLEGLSATCSQPWKEDFKQIAALNGADCMDYVNNLLINMVLDMKNQDSLCSGSLRDKVKG